MKIKVLGCGSAFSMKNWQANYLVMSDDEQVNLLVDCGGDIRYALQEQGLSYKNIQNIYVSHLHFDHCAGVEYMAFCTYFDKTYLRPIDYHNRGIATERKPGLFCQSKLANKLWNNVLSGSLSSVEGTELELDDYFNVHRMYVNDYSVFPGIGKLNIIQTVHIMNGYGIVPTFGLMIASETSKRKVYFTTDTQFNPDQILVFYKEADLIIQDCETASFDSKVHANYKKLKTLPSEIKAKMWLTHYNDGDLPDAKTDGFLGFLQKGQVLEI